MQSKSSKLSAKKQKKRDKNPFRIKKINTKHLENKLKRPKCMYMVLLLGGRRMSAFYGFGF